MMRAYLCLCLGFFFSSRRRHTRLQGDWSSDVCSSHLRERLYAGFHEMRRRLAAARPDLLVMFVNDHLQNFPYSNLPAFCVGLVDAYDAPSPGGSKIGRASCRERG